MEFYIFETLFGKLIMLLAVNRPGIHIKMALAFKMGLTEYIDQPLHVDYD